MSPIATECIVDNDYFALPGRGAKYCDELAYVSVCPLCSRIMNFSVHVTVARSSDDNGVCLCYRFLG